ncbi:MAG: type II toxin-antitoxin system VapC family toxin [Pseudomonadales bacterium]|nr:type II toxin-antitoxin system VapC family toxin [Pseudomonadales bacterium]
MWRRRERNNDIPDFEANVEERDLLRVDVDLLPFEPFATRVWELRDNLTSYDACYVAVAEAIDAPLATLYEKLTRAGGPRCKFVTPSSG